MKRQERKDSPHTIHHVGTRALGRRAMFETPMDFKVFTSLLERAVEGGLLDVLGFSLMTNHVHLLVRTTQFRLAVPLRWVLGQYAQNFNKLRDRDGPLLKCRFFSRPLADHLDLHRVVRYLDHNPVKAGLVEHPSEYPFGSARYYARPDGPGWLCRRPVEEAVCGDASFDPQVYDHFFGRRPDESDQWVVEQGLYRSHRRRLPVVDGAEAMRSDRWTELALNADGHLPGYVIVAPQVVASRVAALRGQNPGRWCPVGRRCGWQILQMGLLRDGAGLRIREIVAFTGRSMSTVVRALESHRQLKAEDPVYRSRAKEVLLNERNDGVVLDKK